MFVRPICCLMSLWLLVTSINQGQSQVVVVHPESTLTEISKKDLQDVFRGRSATLPGGVRAVIVVARQSKSTELFLPEISGGQNYDQFLCGWKRLVYVGKGRLPFFVTTNNDLLDKVAQTPGAIGLAEVGPLRGAKAISLK